jgi:hypothetical protein
MHRKGIYATLTFQPQISKEMSASVAAKALFGLIIP